MVFLTLLSLTSPLHLHLTPRPSPSRHHRFHRDRRSSQCPGHGVGWLAGSCTRPGCMGWSTSPAGGVEPGDSTQPVPGPAAGWPGGSPPPAKPHSLRLLTGPSSRGWSHEGGPAETRRETGDWVCMTRLVLLRVIHFQDYFVLTN